ncbi:hypothetical protein GCM10009696_12490 [Kocuria himachalensis]
MTVGVLRAMDLSHPDAVCTLTYDRRGPEKGLSGPSGSLDTMRIPPASPPDLQGPTTSTPRFESARRNFQYARHELTAAALEELVLRVRIRHPDAARLVFFCDDVEDEISLAEITDGAGRSLGADGPLLDDRTAAQMLGNLHGPDLASLPGVEHDRLEMTFAVEIDAPTRSVAR